MDDIFTSSEKKETATALSIIMCLLFAPLSYQLDYIYNLYLVWSLAFVMPVVLTWETRYTVAIGLCCCSILPFIVRNSSMDNTVFPVIRYVTLLLWLIFVNVCKRKMSKRKPVFGINIYTVQILFFIVLALLYFYIEPAVSRSNFLSFVSDRYVNISPAFRRVSFIHSVITDFMLLTVGELLLELPFVRRFIGLSEYPCSEGSTKIFFISALIAVVFLISDLWFDSIYFNTYGIHSSFVKISNGTGIKTSVIILITATICRSFMFYKRTMLESLNKIRVSEEKLKAIFINMSDMYFEIDKFGIITDVSYSVKRNLGVEMFYPIGLNIRSICKGSQMFEKLEKIRNEGSLLNQEAEFHLGSKELYVLIDVHKKSDRYLLFARDITEIRNDELQIRALNKQLESTVIERTDQLSKAYSDLESFSYTVSHELKTPIREIETYIEFIEEDNAETLNEQSLKDIASIKSVCSNTMHLIQSMMEYSRVGYKALNNEYFDMNTIINECFFEIMKSLPDRQVKLEVGDIPQMYGDKFLIKQLVFNIISNSVKFTKGKSDAKITVTSELNEDTITFFFRDNGVGFEPSSNVHLFNVFDRMHNESDYEGSGVGLATVKKIVKRFNGKATIEGYPNQGCCLTISFPTNNMIR